MSGRRVAVRVGVSKRAAFYLRAVQIAAFAGREGLHPWGVLP